MTPCNRVKKNAVESSKELLIHSYIVTVDFKTRLRISKAFFTLCR